MAVEIDADQRPIQPRRHLLDMGGFAGTVIAADHHPSIEGETGEDCERRVVIEAVGIVKIGDVLARLAKGGNLEGTGDPEGLAKGGRNVGRIEGGAGGRWRWLDGWHYSLLS